MAGASRASNWEVHVGALTEGRTITVAVDDDAEEDDGDDDKDKDDD